MILYGPFDWVRLGVNQNSKAWTESRANAGGVGLLKLNKVIKSKLFFSKSYQKIFKNLFPITILNKNMFFVTKNMSYKLMSVIYN